MRMIQAACALLFALSCAACATQPNTLIFASNDTLGLTIAGGAAEGGGQFTLGYRSQNVAIAPTVRTEPDGTTHAAGGNEPQIATDVRGGSDTYSVLGSFGVETTNSTTPTVSLGRFFSTGLAARELARGFACQQAAEGYGTNRKDTLDPATCVRAVSETRRGGSDAPPVDDGGAGDGDADNGDGS
jgi:hypothetical protein